MGNRPSNRLRCLLERSSDSRKRTKTSLADCASWSCPLPISLFARRSCRETIFSPARTWRRSMATASSIDQRAISRLRVMPLRPPAPLRNELGLVAAPQDGSQPSGRPPVSNLLLQRLGGVGEGLASCGVRDGGSIARLSVFADRPAETAIAQEIGFNRDREGVISGHFNTMRAWRNVFQPVVWP